MFRGFNLEINAARDCGPDSIDFLNPSYIELGETHLGDAPGKVHEELKSAGGNGNSGWRCHSE